MLDVIDITIIPAFLLVFARVLAFLITLPLFSYNTIPNLFKIGFSFILSLVMFTTMDTGTIAFDFTYIFLFIKEIGVGLLIGLIAYIILSAVQIAGGFIDFQMGFAVANVIDPQTGAQSPLIGQYFYMIALLFLLSVNGHYLLIDGIYNSYQFIALDSTLSMGDNYATFIIDAFNQMFLIAFQMSIPLVGCLFLVDVALGLIARTVPQLNVFVVGLPLKIGVSFLVLVVFMAIYITLARMLFETMFDTMHSLMRILGGG